MELESFEGNQRISGSTSLGGLDIEAPSLTEMERLGSVRVNLMACGELAEFWTGQETYVSEKVDKDLRQADWIAEDPIDT